jgi:hypothetical protein
MKTKTPPTTGVVKFNKTSQFEVNAIAQQKKSVNDMLESQKVNLGEALTAADLAFFLKSGVEELNRLQPAVDSPEARKAYLAAEVKRKATGKDSLPYEAFLCYYGKHSAKKRYAMILSGDAATIADAEAQLKQALRTVEKLIKLDAALSAATK